MFLTLTPREEERRFWKKQTGRFAREILAYSLNFYMFLNKEGK